MHKQHKHLQWVELLRCYRYGISAIKEQFKTPGKDSNSPNTTASNMQGQNNNGQQQVL